MTTRTAVGLLALTGIAAGASAQSAFVVFSADKTQVNIGEDVIWTVSVNHTVPGVDAYLAGLSLRFDSSLNGSATAVDDSGAGSMPDSDFQNGDVLGASLDNVIYTDFALLAAGRPGASPFLVGSFTASASQVGAWSYGADLISAGGAIDAIVLAHGGLTALPVSTWTFHDAGAFGQGSDTVTVIPGASPLAVLGAAGLCATRRRRQG